MNIGWPAAIVLVALIFSGVAIVASRLAVSGSIATEEAKGKSGEHYRVLAADYEKLAKETKDVEAAIQADVAVLRDKVDSIEHMMREVG